MANDQGLVTPCEPQICSDDASRYSAYKQLIMDIGDSMDSKDIERLTYLQDIQQIKFESGIKLLSHLERHGRFGPLKTSNLSDMLKSIHREDLVTKAIEPFQQKYNSPSRKSFSQENPEENISAPVTSQEQLSNNYCSDHHFSNESMPFENPLSNTSAVDLSLSHSSTLSVIHQETGDPSLSQQHLSLTDSYDSLRKLHDHQVYSSSPRSAPGAHYHFKSTRNQHTRTSQDTSQSEVYSDLSAEITSESCEYSSSPAPKSSQSIAKNNPLMHRSWRTPGKSSSPETFEQHSSSSHILHSHSSYESSPDYVPGQLQRAERGTLMPKSISFSHHPIPPSSHPKGITKSVSESHSLTKCAGVATHTTLLQQAENFQSNHEQPGASLVNSSQHECHTVNEQSLNHDMDRKSKEPRPTIPQVIAIASKVHENTIDLEQAKRSNQQLKLKKSDPSNHTQSLSSACAADSDSESQSSSTITGTTPNISQTTVSAKAIFKLVPDAKEQDLDVDVSPLQKDPESAVPVKQKTTRTPAFNLDKPSYKWTVNRLKLNKAIYAHEEKSVCECKKKFEVDVGNGNGLNPKLTLMLHPCGLEKDVKAENATLVIQIFAPKKAPPLNESACVVLLIKVTEGGNEADIINETACEVNLNSRVVRKFGIISHEALKKSKSETIIIEVKVCSI